MDLSPLSGSVEEVYQTATPSEQLSREIVRYTVGISTVVNNRNKLHHPFTHSLAHAPVYSLSITHLLIYSFIDDFSMSFIFLPIGRSVAVDNSFTPFFVEYDCLSRHKNARSIGSGRFY
jgi:hypothetical protein